MSNIPKTIKFGNDARQQIIEGVRVAVAVVSSTMGPGGTSVIIKEGGYGEPKITKDGVSVCRSIALKNKLQNVGVDFVKMGSNKMLSQVGDGTTCVTTLLSKIFEEGFQLLTAGYSGMQLKKGIDKGTKVVVDFLNDLSIQVESREQIEQIATISANGDREIGNLIAEATTRVGKEGVISVEGSQTDELGLESAEGLSLEKGFISPYFVNDFEKIRCDYTDAFILLHDGRLDDVQTLVPLLSKISKMGKPLLIIAEDFSPIIISTAIQNVARKTIAMCLSRTSGYGDDRREILKDIAILTKATIFGPTNVMKIEQADTQYLGQAKRVLVDRITTTIIGGAGTKEDIQLRVKQIKADIDAAEQLGGPENTYYVGKTKKRLAKLISGTATIKVGAPTELEMKEKKDRVEDSLHATRAALGEGIVAGGGVALLRAIPTLKAFIETLTDRGEREGAKIILNALEAPIRTIVENAGGKPDIVVDRVLSNDNPHFGYNAATDTYEDLVQTGIIDPKKVVRCALQNAASVASMLITTEALVVDDDGEEGEDE